MLEIIREHQSSRIMEQILDSKQNHVRITAIKQKSQEYPKIVRSHQQLIYNYNVIISALNYHSVHYVSETVLDAGTQNLRHDPSSQETCTLMEETEM